MSFKNIILSTLERGGERGGVIAQKFFNFLKYYKKGIYELVGLGESCPLALESRLRTASSSNPPCVSGMSLDKYKSTFLVIRPPRT